MHTPLAPRTFTPTIYTLSHAPVLYLVSTEDPEFPNPSEDYLKTPSVRHSTRLFSGNTLSKQFAISECRDRWKRGPMAIALSTRVKG